MAPVIQQTLLVVERLDEASQLSVLKFAEFLAAGPGAGTALNDKAFAADDNQRGSSKDFGGKHGIKSLRNKEDTKSRVQVATMMPLSIYV